jgi:iron(III) transport system substrate-binding protein
VRYLLLLCWSACRVEFGPPGGTAAPAGDAPSGEVWIYTSMYPSVIESFEALLRQELPQIEPRFYQAGSEKVAQRIEAEWTAGGSPACLVLTSDPFWYVRSARAGRLQRHLAPDVLRIDRALVDPDGTWATARLSLMVLAVPESMPAQERPRRFSDLADPRFAGRITIGDPLASGTTYTWLAFMLQEGGWTLVDQMRANGLVAAGGSSAVLGRITSGERPVGALLLENLLSADGTVAVPVFPEDGAVLVPGPIALTAECRNPVAARAIYDLILSRAGQQLIVAGDMYSPLPSLPPPQGAPPLTELAVRPWRDGLLEELVQQQGETKERWAQ